MSPDIAEEEIQDFGGFEFERRAGEQHIMCVVVDRSAGAKNIALGGISSTCLEKSHVGDDLSRIAIQGYNRSDCLHGRHYHGIDLEAQLGG